MNTLKRLWQSRDNLSVRAIRFSKWNKVLLFAVSVIVSDLHLVDHSGQVLIFNSSTVQVMGYAIGILIFAFLPSSRILDVGRFGAVLALASLIAQTLTPQSVMLEICTLFSFATGICIGYALYIFFFFMNNAERLLNLVLIQLYFAILVYGLSRNFDERIGLHNVLGYIFIAFFVLSLFKTKKSGVPKKDLPKPGGCGSEESCCPVGKSGMWILFYVYIIFAVIDSVNRFIVHKDVQVDQTAYSAGIVIAIAVAVAVMLVFRKSTLYIWKIFLLGSLLSMALLAIDGVFDLKAGSWLCGLANSLGYISIFFLIGGSANLTGCLKLFRWFCIIEFLLSFILDPVVEYIFGAFSEPNSMVALILVIVMVCITYSRYSVLYSRIFESNWIQDLNIFKQKAPKPKVGLGTKTAAGEEAKTEAGNKDELDHAEELGLTPREKQIFSLMLTDMSIKEIIIELEISKGTLNFHTMNLYRKLEIQSRTELFVKYSTIG
jgi:DNA-binding CsgD family transcriptional regulator